MPRYRKITVQEVLRMHRDVLASIDARTRELAEKDESQDLEKVLWSSRLKVLESLAGCIAQISGQVHPGQEAHEVEVTDTALDELRHQINEQKIDHAETRLKKLEELLPPCDGELFGKEREAEGNARGCG